jgi:hypothetical protein
MIGSGMRAILGFVAAAIAVLTFHQAMWALLHFLNLPGLGVPPPYPKRRSRHGSPPYRGSSVLGWLYGILFGLALPWLRPPYWLDGLSSGSSLPWSGSS